MIREAKLLAVEPVGSMIAFFAFTSSRSDLELLYLYVCILAEVLFVWKY